jgi:nicotinamidase/pyrazinamidase
LQSRFDLVVATQDWHPADHGSFAANHPGKQPFEDIVLHGLPQKLWPVHCVQGSKGAEFVADLNLDRVDKVFRKGTDATIDSYSGFYDNGHRKATGLTEYLKGKNVSEVYVVGIATDYCVKFTALDALQEGFKTFVVQDACRGVDLPAGTAAAALVEMTTSGVNVIHSSNILS